MSLSGQRGCSRLDGVPQAGLSTLSPALQEHAAECSTCGAVVRAVDLARAARPRPPRPDQVLAMRSGLRAAALAQRAPRGTAAWPRLAALAAAALAIAAGVLFLLSSRPAP